MRSGKDPRTRRVEQALITSAFELLEEGGWDAMTAPALSARAGVSRSTLYARFGGVEEVVLRGLLERFATEFPSFAEHAEQDPSAPALLDPDTLLARGKPLTYPVFAHVHTHRDVYRVVFSEPRGAQVVDGLERMLRMGSSSLHAPLRQASEADIEPGLLASFLSGAMIGLLRWWLTEAVDPPTPLAMSYQFSRLAAPGLLGAMGLDDD